jgi:hypothetical protein
LEETMTQDQALIALSILRATKLVAQQIRLADLTDLPDELRASLLAERDALNADWAALMPDADPA